MTETPSTPFADGVAADSAEMHAAFARKAQALKLTAPALPLGSLCMDGRPYTNRFWAAPHEETFPTAPEAFAERLGDMGSMWGKKGVLEYVDAQGSYHVARDVEANRAALKEAGFRDSGAYRAFFTDGVQPAGGDAKTFEEMLRAPQSSAERLAGHVRECDLAQADAAIAAGGRIQDAKAYDGTSPVVFDILPRTHPGRNDMIRRLLPACASAARPSGETLLHGLLASGADASGLIVDCVHAGADPFACDAGGVPPFLALRMHKPSAAAELAQMRAAMLERLHGKQGDVMQAQLRFIGGPLEAGDPDEAHRRAGKLKETWKLASVFSPQQQGPVPGQVMTFLEPMTDNRAARFNALLCHYDVAALHGENEAAHEFAARVVLPLALAAYARQKGCALNDETLFAFDPARGRIMEALVPMVKAELFKARSLDKIIGVNEAWYDRRSAFPDSLQPLRAKGQWHSLLGGKELAIPSCGLILRVLTDDRELAAAGQAMDNCAGRAGRGKYASLCLDGESHLFTLHRNSEPQPLAMMEAKCKGHFFTVAQNAGLGNAAPLPEAKKAMQWLERQVACGGLPLNPLRGETEESLRRNPRPKLLRVIGFEPDPAAIQAAFTEIGHNIHRKAMVFNADSKRFEPSSRQHGMIGGSHYAPLLEDGTPRRDAQGNRVTDIPYRNLPAEQWFEVSGMREKAMALLAPMLDETLAQTPPGGRSWGEKTARREASGRVNNR